MAARIGLRGAQGFRQSSMNFRQNFRFSQRRFQSTAEGASNAEAANNQSGFAKFWNSPIGPKTVHFWAPVMKWGMVAVGASDFTRPADQLSLTQNVALMCTGLIWTRWCFVIRPKNVLLASVNFLLFLVGGTQVTRVVRYQQSVKGESLSDEAKDVAKDVKGKIEKAIEDPKSVVQGK